MRTEIDVIIMLLVMIVMKDEKRKGSHFPMGQVTIVYGAIIISLWILEHYSL